MAFVSSLIGKVQSALGYGTHLNAGIPGVSSSDPTLGNLGDMGKAGSLHQYLQNLHAEHGAVVSFWWGADKLVVSTTAAVFKDTIKLADRPQMLFAMFMPLIGENSIQYANGEDLAFRKKHYIDAEFSHKVITEMHWTFESAAKDLVANFKQECVSGPIEIRGAMMQAAMKTILQFAFGENADDNDLQAIIKAYELTWHEMEVRLTGDMPAEGSPRIKDFEDALASFKGAVGNILERKQGSGQEGERGWVYSLINTPGISPDQVKNECVTMLVGGFHTTGNLLAWAFYFLAAHPDIQAKTRAEIQGILGDRAVPTADEAKQMTYTDKVVRETLRCSVLAPWAARVAPANISVGGYDVPAGTPIIQALGVSLHDASVWPNPEEFRPERFDDDQARERAALSFSPFGFAGKRICPGMRLANMESVVMVAAVLQNFSLNLAPGHPKVERSYSLVTSPSVPVHVIMKPL